MHWNDQLLIIGERLENLLEMMLEVVSNRRKLIERNRSSGFD